jgi:acetoin utilization protein AcuB
MTKVADRMARDIVFVREHESLRRVAELLHEKGIRHLPVLAELENLVGIVTDRDIKLAMPSPLFGQDADWQGLFEEVAVSRVMAKDLITVSPDALMQEAVSLMIAHRVGCLPVVEEGSLVGLLTETDAMRHCIEVIQTYGG